ncbi:hypothetical protein [Lactobacillus apis]|uniref:hypothetical protein n=1 Tax=Lactobacillus apis TaxID=303541 RepID=UPI00242B4BDC|nr:hypothetical protein [Lactobacillus apis]
MKAYRVLYQGEFFPYVLSEDIVFANTRKRARSKFMADKSVFWGNQFCIDEEGMKFTRCKELDNCEKLSLMKIYEKLIYDIPDSSKYTMIGDRTFSNGNSTKEEFEKAWIKEYGSEETNNE